MMNVNINISLSASPETLNAVAKKLVVAAHNLAGQVVAIYEAIHSADLSGFARFVGDSLAAFEDAVRVTRPLDVKMFSKLTKTAMKFILHQREMAQELGRLTSFLDFFFDKYEELGCRYMSNGFYIIFSCLTLDIDKSVSGVYMMIN